MKRIKSIDLIAFTYCLYFSITLAIDQNMFDKQTQLYEYFQRINSSEMVWGVTALFISIIYMCSFLFNNQKWLSVVASILSGLFFIVVGSAYMITYPNIGSGIFTIIGIVCLMNVGDIVITEDVIKERDQIHENTNRD